MSGICCAKCWCDIYDNSHLRFEFQGKTYHVCTDCLGLGFMSLVREENKEETNNIIDRVVCHLFSLDSDSLGTAYAKIEEEEEEEGEES